MGTVTVARVAAALLDGEVDVQTLPGTGTGPAAGAHDGDTAHVTRTPPEPSRLPESVTVALHDWRLAPRAPGPARALAVALLDAAERNPGLRAWIEHAVAPPTAHHNVLTADAPVEGPVVQARDISGGLHVHAPPARALPVPSQLPPAPARLVGRSADQSALAGLAGHGLVVVSGLAGAGKTALVSHWLRTLRDDYPDGQLHADLRGHAPGTPAAPTEVLGRFLRSYGYRDLPADLAEQAALWRSATGRLRILVMLDNAISAAQVRPLLAGAPGSLIVVVSRSRLSGLLADGAAHHELGLLEPSDAAELFAGRIGRTRADRERRAVDDIVALCAGLPLAICLAGARVASRPRSSVAALARALEEGTSRLETLRAGGDLAVRAALDDSCAALPAAADRAYRLLGALPFTAFDADLASAACGPGPAGTESVLETLVEVSLLEDLGEDRFRFHDLVRLHAAERAAGRDTPEERSDSLYRACCWLLAAATEAEALLTPNHRTLERGGPAGLPTPPAFGVPVEALEWLGREQAQLMTALRVADSRGWDATVWQLADALWPLWHRLRPYDLWIEAHERGLAAARRLAHPAAVSRMLTTLANCLYNAGRIPEAVDRFTEALDDAVTGGDHRAQSQSLHGLGRCHEAAGRPAEAVAHYRRALALRERTGYRRGAALTRVCLGDLAASQGRFGEAVAELERAQQDLAAVPDPHDAARARALLGRARAGQGEHTAARRHLEAALEEFTAIGSVHWQARTMEFLGLTALDEGDLPCARQWLGRAHDAYAAISPRDTQRLLERISSLDGPSPSAN